MENFELIKLKLDNKHKVEDLDEVSTELLKAQQRLEQLVKKTSPVLSKCKKELEAEHAHWLTTRALNSIDDEVIKRRKNSINFSVVLVVSACKSTSRRR